MPNYLGRTISRLVRRRAYLAGDLLKFEERADEIRRALAAADQAVLDVRQELAALDAEIETKSGLDGDDIRAIRHVPRATLGRHGTFVRKLVEIFKEAGGPISMDDLVAQMASGLSVDLSTAAERRRFGSMVRRTTNRLRLKDAVMRLSAEPGKTTGVWCWIAD